MDGFEEMGDLGDLVFGLMLAQLGAKIQQKNEDYTAEIRLIAEEGGPMAMFKSADLGLKFYTELVELMAPVREKVEKRLDREYDKEVDSLMGSLDSDLEALLNPNEEKDND